MPQEKCKHIHIKIVSNSYYTIPQGYEELSEQDDIDMQDYLIEILRDKIVCDDCVEVLDA